MQHTQSDSSHQTRALHQIWTSSIGFTHLGPALPAPLWPPLASHWPATPYGGSRVASPSFLRILTALHPTEQRAVTQVRYIVEGTRTSTTPNFYTGLKFGSKKHFYGRVAPEGILTLHIKNDLFTAAERPKRILVSKCTFTRHVKTVVSYNVLRLYLYYYCIHGSEDRAGQKALF